jgi:hypothetical protein
MRRMIVSAERQKITTPVLGAPTGRITVLRHSIYHVCFRTKITSHGA